MMQPEPIVYAETVIEKIPGEDYETVINTEVINYGD
jgi:hypothetical protein